MTRKVRPNSSRPFSTRALALGLLGLMATTWASCIWPPSTGNEFFDEIPPGVIVGAETETVKFDKTKFKKLRGEPSEWVKVTNPDCVEVPPAGVPALDDDESVPTHSISNGEPSIWIYRTAPGVETPTGTTVGWEGGPFAPAGWQFATTKPNYWYVRLKN